MSYSAANRCPVLRSATGSPESTSGRPSGPRISSSIFRSAALIASTSAVVACSSDANRRCLPSAAKSRDSGTDITTRARSSATSRPSALIGGLLLHAHRRLRVTPLHSIRRSVCSANANRPPRSCCSGDSIRPPRSCCSARLDCPRLRWRPAPRDPAPCPGRRSRPRSPRRPAAGRRHLRRRAHPPAGRLAVAAEPMAENREAPPPRAMSWRPCSARPRKSSRD